MPPLQVSKDHVSHLASHITSDTLSDSVPITHYLYFRKHETRKENSELPNDRTLFVLNLPVDSTVAHLQRLFRRCGKIENVIFQNRNCAESFPDFEPRAPLREIYKSGGRAHIVFEEEEAVEKALNLKNRKRIWSDQLDEEGNQETSISLGLSSRSLFYIKSLTPLILNSIWNRMDQ